MLKIQGETTTTAQPTMNVYGTLGADQQLHFITFTVSFCGVKIRTKKEATKIMKNYPPRSLGSNGTIILIILKLRFTRNGIAGVECDDVDMVEETRESQTII